MRGMKRSYILHLWPISAPDQLADRMIQLFDRSVLAPILHFNFIGLHDITTLHLRTLYVL